jgi:hypothetical protein
VDCALQANGACCGLAMEADKAIVRMETKIEYIIIGIDEIKAEVKNSN